MRQLSRIFSLEIEIISIYRNIYIILNTRTDNPREINKIEKIETIIKPRDQNISENSNHSSIFNYLREDSTKNIESI